MDYMLLYSEYHSSTVSIMSGHPSKKIRLDFKNDGSTSNEDLWGQDDLTAEEFDMLEIQATQSCNHSVIYPTNVLHNQSTKQDDSGEVEDLKQLQYELEGRVKLLSQSLEKSARELNEERSNREGIIKERMKQFSERETDLQKEVQKMQSILEFKEQEMKSVYSKLQLMRSKLQNRKGASPERSMNMNFDDLLQSSKCRLDEYSVRPNFLQKFHRKHKLLVDTPKGEMKGIEILSSVLCTRLAIPPFQSAVNGAFLENSSFKCGFTPISVVHLKNEQKSDELLEYYSCFLRNHVALLKTLTSKSNAVNSNKSSPMSTKCKESNYSHTVLSYLRDITYIFSCQTSDTIPKVCEFNQENFSENICSERTEELSSSDTLIEKKVPTNVGTISQLLESLSALSNPKTYPIGYFKNEEMQCSFTALLTICLSCPKRFLDLIGELPLHSFVNPHQSVTDLCTTLKLITVLCCCRNFNSYLMHRNSNCIFCLIAAFLLNIVPRHSEKFAVSVILIEDFLSTAFSLDNFVETHLESFECISQAIQGLIKSLWKYYQLREKNSINTEIIKKGLLLLHFITCCIPNFKEKRNLVEDEYVSLISGILAVSRENSELREFYDLIQSLWDFQTDITEFDLDELSEETQTSTNEISIK